MPDTCQWLYPDAHEGWEEFESVCTADAVVGLIRPFAIGGQVVTLLCSEHRQEMNRPHDEVLPDRRDAAACQWYDKKKRAVCDEPGIKEVKVPTGIGTASVVDLCRVHVATMNESFSRRRAERKAASK